MAPIRPVTSTGEIDPKYTKIKESLTEWSQYALQRMISELDGPIPMNILIADDHSLIRELFAAVLAARFPGSVIHEAGDLATTRKLLSGAAKYDIVLLDLQMPGMRGIESAVSLSEDNPQSKTIVVTGNEDPCVALEALRHGLNGYVPKSLGVEAAVNAVKLVLSGETYVPSLILHGVVYNAENVRPLDVKVGRDTPTANDADDADESDADDAVLETLTDRELAVLLAISQGMSNKEIANKFDVAEITVKVHAQGIYRKLGVSNRTQAAAVYLTAC